MLDNLVNEEPIVYEGCSESGEELYEAANAIEREFLRLGLMHRWPIETVGITLIQLCLDGQKMYVRTFSMHWWRFIFEQLELPFPLVLEGISFPGPGSDFKPS